MRRSCHDEQAAYIEGDQHAADHVESCPRCAPTRPSLDDVRSRLADPGMWCEPDPGLEDRVVAAVGAAVATPDPSDTSDPVVVPLRSRSPARRGGNRRIWLVTVAACVGTAIASVATVGVLDREPGADVQVALHATPLARGASAKADIHQTDSGIEIRLRPTGLRPAPAGSFYQAWVKGPNGLVAIGTFHSGEGEIILWSGVALEQYPTITVTLEREDGDPSSSGHRVLVGELTAPDKEPDR